MSINDTINRNSQKAKYKATEAAQYEDNVNALGRDVAQQYSNLYSNPDVYNTRLASLTQAYSDLDDQMNSLLYSKYGDNYDTSKGFTDPYDTKGYNEYMRLANLRQDAQNSIDSLRQNEQSRISEISTQDSNRLAQQKYLDEYAKMQGMGNSGYNTNLQSDIYNNYMNNINQINQNANNNANSIVNSYRDAELSSRQSAFEEALNNAQIDVANYGTLLQSTTSLEDLDKLNERYSDVLPGAMKNDRNLKETINQQGANLLVTKAFTQETDENGNVTYIPVLSDTSWEKLKKDYPDYYNTIDEDTKKYLESLYAIVKQLRSFFRTKY